MLTLMNDRRHGLGLGEATSHSQYTASRLGEGWRRSLESLTPRASEAGSLGSIPHSRIWNTGRAWLN
jgi:hypothetical protein